jgi:hypothetical protein
MQNSGPADQSGKGRWNNPQTAAMHCWRHHDFSNSPQDCREQDFTVSVKLL